MRQLFWVEHTVRQEHNWGGIFVQMNETAGILILKMQTQLRQNRWNCFKKKKKNCWNAESRLFIREGTETHYKANNANRKKTLDIFKMMPLRLMMHAGGDGPPCLHWYKKAACYKQMCLIACCWQKCFLSEVFFLSSLLQIFIQQVRSLDCSCMKQSCCFLLDYLLTLIQTVFVLIVQTNVERQCV